MRTALIISCMHTVKARKPASNWFLTTLICLCLSVPAATAVAQASDARSNAGLLQLHARVDELYERGEFERAYLIYRDELASIGDKYAQYMVGFMHLTGKGVDEDPVAASAWYRLAAERGTPEFVAVRDFLLTSLTPEEQEAWSKASFARWESATPVSLECTLRSSSVWKAVCCFAISEAATEPC